MTNPTGIEVTTFLDQLYGSFDTGYDFEQFVKLLLVKMGLEDVTVTARSGDGGLDVLATRRGVEGLSAVDELRYVVQAKRYKPTSSVPVVHVRALRGVMPASSMGIFITTGRFSKAAVGFAVEDPARPVLLIDGRAVVELCIKHRIGFRFRPVFDRNKLQAQLGQETGEGDAASTSGTVTVMRTITDNDIRARIIGVPPAIRDAIPEDVTRLSVSFPPLVAAADYTYRRDRN